MPCVRCFRASPDFSRARRKTFVAVAMMHPCLRCGACCAHFRVSFHWSEAEPSLGGEVPLALTEQVDAHRLAMRGTWAARPHCAALRGTVGQEARCGIYQQRPSVCRDVLPSWESGAASQQCDKARAAYGLAPLTPEDWLACSQA
jgi:uncharacterized protein